MMKSLKFASAVIALAFASTAFAQVPGTVTWDVTTTASGGQLTPRITWSTSPAAASCTASSDAQWMLPSATKAASGTQVLPAINSGKTYNLTCTWAGGAVPVTVSWVLPTTNTDGTPYANPKGVKIYRAASAATVPQGSIRVVNNPTDTSSVYTDLLAGTHYFGVVVVNSNDADSAMSNIGSKTIGGGTGGTVVARTLVIAFPNTTIITVN